VPVRALFLRLARISVGAVLLGASIFAMAAPAAAPKASADVGAPSWWSGDCDANHWNAVAATLGWTGAGAHRLGASFAGVPVCGPRRSGDGAPDVQWSRPGWGHFEWECTELAFRFMAQVYGVAAYGANGDSVVTNYNTSYGGGLVKYTNSTPGVAPTPGDVISFSNPGGVGHVAIVTASTVTGAGNGSLTLMTQNDTVDGWRTITVTGWTVQGFGAYTPTGWLHDPLGRASTPNKPTWFLRNTLTTGVADASFTYGSLGDQVLACDWDGDGIDTAATFRDGWWTIVNQNSGSAVVTVLQFGSPGDIPVCGDWNGDSYDTIGVFRQGWFYLRNSNSSGFADLAFPYGNPGDTPVVGDWNGDGVTTVGVTRDGWFHLRNANSAGYADTTFAYGNPGDRPLAGDWNGDGVDTIGIWRDGALYLHNQNASGYADYVFAYGNPGDAPVIGDWNGAGNDVLGVVRGAA